MVSPRPKVLILTTFDHEEYAYEALRENVFAKLGLRDRVQAVVLADESGLVEVGMS